MIPDIQNISGSGGHCCRQHSGMEFDRLCTDKTDAEGDAQDNDGTAQVIGNLEQKGGGNAACQPQIYGQLYLAQIFGISGHHVGKKQYDRYLYHFRNLKPDSAPSQPAFGAVDGNAERRQQQEDTDNGNHISNPGQPHQFAVIIMAKAQDSEESRDHKEGLALKIIHGVIITFFAGSTLERRGRKHHDQSETAQKDQSDPYIKIACHPSSGR